MDLTGSLASARPGLVLASRGIPAALRGYARGPRVALVSNAMDSFGRVRREQSVARDTATLRSLGFDVVPLDLRGFDAADGRLRRVLDGTDVVWCGGGNTFGLVHQMARSGFTDLAGELVDDGVLYGGSSAGAAAAAPSLEGVALIDDPRVSPAPAQPALGLVEFLTWPHWRPAEGADVAAQRCEPMPLVPYSVIRLRDGEHLLVDGVRVELVEPSVTAPDPDPGALTLF